MSHWPTDRSLRGGINRREVLLNGSSTLAAACIASMAPANFTSALAQLPSRQPHIVYIVADDLGWKDVGFHGSDIKTPNIDALAQSGARLEQFYVQPMCTPTRAALMTGRYPNRYGLQTLVIPTPRNTACQPTNGCCPRRSRMQAIGRPWSVSGTWVMPTASIGRGSAGSITTTDPWWAKSTTSRIHRRMCATGFVTTGRSTNPVT